MKARFEKIVQDCGLKHWSFGVKRDKELLDWISEQPLIFLLIYHLLIVFIRLSMVASNVNVEI
jgi:hypothetical protein